MTGVSYRKEKIPGSWTPNEDWITFPGRDHGMDGHNDDEFLFWVSQGDANQNPMLKKTTAEAITPEDCAAAFAF